MNKNLIASKSLEIGLVLLNEHIMNVLFPDRVHNIDNDLRT